VRNAILVEKIIELMSVAARYGWPECAFPQIRDRG
jgi:hypothetical protein